jgi:hypothetical protein
MRPRHVGAPLAKYDLQIAAMCVYSVADPVRERD